MKLPPIGSVVYYTDHGGVVYNALVTYVWPTCINLLYVVSDGDSYSERLYATSVPPFTEGMSGNYFKYEEPEIPS